MFKKLKDAKKYLNEKKQLRLIKKDYRHIVDISNPTEEMQLEAIRQNPRIIRYINNPCEKAQLKAVSNYCGLIRYIENPTKKTIALATRGMIDSQDLEEDKKETLLKYYDELFDIDIKERYYV